MVYIAIVVAVSCTTSAFIVACLTIINNITDSIKRKKWVKERKKRYYEKRNMER